MQASDGQTLFFDIAVTLDDQVAVLSHLLDQPSLRRRRLAMQAAIVLVTPWIGALLGTFAGWLGDRREPYWVSIAAMADDLRSGLLPVMLTISAGLTAVFVLQRLTRRPRLRRTLRRLLRERPGVDPADPAATERASCTLGPDGFRSRGTASVLDLGWPAIKGLVESLGQMMVRTGRLAGFVIPKRGLAPGMEDAIRTMVTQRAAGSPIPPGR